VCSCSGLSVVVGKVRSCFGVIGCVMFSLTVIFSLIPDPTIILFFFCELRWLVMCVDFDEERLLLRERRALVLLKAVYDDRCAGVRCRIADVDLRLKKLGCDDAV